MACSFGCLYPEGVKLAKSSGQIKVMSGTVLFELQDSDLVTQYPNETAELLIFLCTSQLGHQAIDLLKVAKRVTNLPQELRKKLDESIARLGF